MRANKSLNRTATAAFSGMSVAINFEIPVVGKLSISYHVFKSGTVATVMPSSAAAAAG
jgi:hypothetical protein